MAVDEGLASKATQAEFLLKNPFFDEVWNELESEILELWKNSLWEDSKKRDFLWMYQKVMQQFRGRLEKYIADAKFDRANEKAKEKASGIFEGTPFEADA